jgi:hypothetical protein
VLSVDGSQLFFLVLTDDPKGQGLWLWGAAREKNGGFAPPVRIRRIGDSDSALVAAKDSATLLWGSVDVNGTWHLVLQLADRYQDLGCARSASLLVNNGDPDLN